MRKSIFINIITPFTNVTFKRQLSDEFQRQGIFFFENSTDDRVWDMVVVYEGLKTELKIRCKLGGTVFISGEPPMSRKYSTKFLRQFDHLITSHTNLKHPNNHLNQQALPWHFGLNFRTKKFNFNWDELNQMQAPKKSKKIALISSDKKLMPGHIQRVAFLDALKAKFSNQVDFFGQGIHPIDDKADAILPYQFTICIENSFINNYWTEKIADSFLGFSIPIYSGCMNITDYFDVNSFIKIDAFKINKSIEIIDDVLLNSDKIYNQKLKYLIESRNDILKKYNIYPMLSQFYDAYCSHEIFAKHKLHELKPSESFWDYKIKMYCLRFKRKTSRFKSLSTILP